VPKSILTTAVDYSLDLDGGDTPPSDQYRIMH